MTGNILTIKKRRRELSVILSVKFNSGQKSGKPPSGAKETPDGVGPAKAGSQKLNDFK